MLLQVVLRPHWLMYVVGYLQSHGKLKQFITKSRRNELQNKSSRNNQINRYLIFGAACGVDEIGNMRGVKDCVVPSSCIGH